MILALLKNPYLSLCQLTQYLLTLGACVICLCNSLQAAPITLYAEHFPPYTIDAHITPNPLNTRQQSYGLDIEIVRAAFQEVDQQVNIKFLPWRRIIRNIEQGSALGVLSCRYVKEREAAMIYSDQVSDSQLAFVMAKNINPDDLNQIEDLSEKQVVIVSGYAQEPLLKSMGIRYIGVANIMQALNVIIRRESEVFIGSYEGAAYEASLLGYTEALNFKAIKESGWNSYHVCFSRKYPDAEQWAEKLNEGLFILKSEGKLEAIKQRYSF
jgi:polar amino acid transport system substrate-binding protein